MATPKLVLESPKFGALDFGGVSGTATTGGNKQATIGARYVIGGNDYYFIPENYILKGAVKDGEQVYSPSMLNRDRLNQLYTSSEVVDLGSDIDNPASNLGSKGFLMLPETFNKLFASTRSYQTNQKVGKTRVGEIKGLGEVKGNLVYSAKTKGGDKASAWIQPPDTKAYDGRKTGEGEIQARYTTGSGPLYDFGKAVGGVPFLPEIAGFVTGNPLVYAALKGSALGAQGVDPLKAGLQVGATVFASELLSGSPAEAAPVGGTPGVSEVFPVDMSVGGTVTPIPPMSIGIPEISLLDGVTFPGQGLTVPSISSPEIELIPGGTRFPGEGLLSPSTPGIPIMGGGQGLTVGVPGGTVGAGGFTAIDAVPVLGEPGSFINDPNVLGKDVIKAAGSSLSLADILEGADILKGAKLVNDLIGGGGQPSTQRTMSRPRFTPTGVSPLELLKLYASTPDVSGLLTQRRSRAAPGFDLLSSQRFPSRNNLSLIGP